MVQLKEQLKAYARSIGVHHLGVGPAEPFWEARKLLETMHEQGTYPAFTQRDVELRTRPERWLQQVKSIIAIAVSYLTDDEHHPPMRGTPRGLVSRYAWGDDYHPILREKLDLIAAYLRERLGRDVRFAPFVDTGPPVDRAVAVRSGIGWYGKNACVFTPRHGSYVFLAQVATDVELPPDPPIHRSCGTCDRCIRACPTGAIERPFWVNPAKCLSYITQMPGMIPKEYRKAMGRHLWGCDICQIVCPWNWEAQPAGDGAFRPSEELGARPALDSSPDYDQLAVSPLVWDHRHGMAREKDDPAQCMHLPGKHRRSGRGPRGWPIACFTTRKPKCGEAPPGR